MLLVKDHCAGFQAVVIGEPHRALYGNQFGLDQFGDLIADLGHLPVVTHQLFDDRTQLGVLLGKEREELLIFAGVMVFQDRAERQAVRPQVGRPDATALAEPARWHGHEIDDCKPLT